MIVDDDDLMRAGLRAILESDPDIEVVAEAGDGRRALIRARDLLPDLVLMDVRMPELDGIAATRELTALDDPPRVLVLTTFAHDEYVLDALRVGAAGFMLKRSTPEELIASVKAAAAGETPLAREVVGTVVAHMAEGAIVAAPGDDYDRLTPREREVLDGLARGLSNAEIADTLVVQASTVKSHVKGVLGKLGLRDRVQAVIYAYEHGIARPGADSGDGGDKDGDSQRDQ